MRTTRRGALAAAALVMTLSACGGGGTEEPSVSAVASGDLSAADEEALGGADAVAAMQALYEQAQADGETTVSVYGPGETDKGPMYEVFSQRFPGLTVDGQFLVGADLTARLEGEVASGQHVADLVQSGDTSVVQPIAQGYFQQFTPVTAEGLDPGYSDPTGTVLAPSATAFGFMYNTNLMSADEAPAGWDDLLDEQYRGEMTSDDVTTFGGGFSTLSHMLFDGRRGEEWLQGLADQDITPQSSLPVAGSTVATGEHAMVPWYVLSFYLRDKAQGAPVGFVFPTEGGVHLSPHYLGLMDGAPSPSAAQLLETWMFTPEGQQAAAEVGYYPLMPGEPGPQDYPPADELDLLAPFPLDQVGPIANQNLATIRNAFGS